MSRTRNLSDLLDSNGDVKSGALDNVPASDLASDTSPQLSGDLDTNGNNINFGDNDVAQFGAGNDLQIFHNGANSKIASATGDLIISTAGTESIFMQDAGGNNLAQFNDNSDVKLYYNANEKLATAATGVEITGDIVVASGNGIDFSATANSAGTMQNELLDSYEEGLWTPTFSTNSGNAASAGAVLGTYTKIGRLVFVHGSLTNIDKSGTTSSSQLRIVGLPFTVDAVSNTQGATRHHTVNYQTGRSMLHCEASSSEFVRFLQSGDNVADTPTDHNDITTGTTDIIFSVSYMTDQ